MLPTPTVPVAAVDAERLGLKRCDDGVYRLPRCDDDSIIDDTLPGFRGGFASSWALISRVEASGVHLPRNKGKAYLESKGYVCAGRAKRSLPEEGNTRPTIYMKVGQTQPVDLTDAYCVAQGYEMDVAAAAPRVGRTRLSCAEIAARLDFTREGFRGGFVSSWAFKRALPIQVYGHNVRRIEEVMAVVGYRKAGRLERRVPEENGSKPDVYVNHEVDGDLWTAYRRAQSYRV